MKDFAINVLRKFILFMLILSLGLSTYLPMNAYVNANELITSTHTQVYDNDQQNLLTNSSFEQVAPNGLPEYWGRGLISGTATATVDQTYSTEGNSSLKIQSQATARMAVNQKVSVEAGNSYTIALDVKTEGIVSNDLGVTVRLQYFNEDNESVGTRNFGNWKGSNDWFHTDYTFVPPAGVTEVLVELFLWNATGTVWFDDVTLVQNDQGIQNGGFEQIAVNGRPEHWNIVLFSGTPYVLADNEHFSEGEHSLLLQSQETARVAAAQSVPIIGGKNYKLSADIKMNQVTSNALGVVIRVQFYNHSNQNIGVEYFDNQRGTKDWERSEIFFRAPDDAVRTTIELFLWEASGSVWFDNVSIAESVPTPEIERAYFDKEEGTFKVIWDAEDAAQSDFTLSIFAGYDTDIDSSVLVKEGVPITAGQALIDLEHLRYPFIFIRSYNETSGFSGIESTYVEESDETFFGYWDADASEWLAKGKINYAFSEDLQPVELAVKTGDYEGAKQALLTYYQSRQTRTFLPYPETTRNSDLLEINLDNIFTLGGGEKYVTTFSVGSEDTTVAIDVTEQFGAISDSRELAFFLMARRNEASTAQFYSKEHNGHQPMLEVEINGTTHTFQPIDDTFIRAETHANTNFGGESTLEVRDEGPGAFTDETRKSYLKFDLSDLPAGTPSNMKLILTGKNTTSSENKEIMLYQYSETNFSETNITWNNTVQNTFSWEGLDGGYDWLTPVGADPEYGWQVARFGFSHMAAYEYQLTQDENIVSRLLDLMVDFIDDAESYEAPFDLGSGSFPRSIDTGIRARNWVQSYHFIRASSSLDAETNIKILKKLHKSGDYLRTQYWAGSNWGVIEKDGLYRIAVYFPEFVSSQEWLDNANEKLQDSLSNSILPDGGYVEASTSYGVLFTNLYTGIANFSRVNGQPFTASNDLHRLARHIMDSALPNGDDPGFGDSGGDDLLQALRNYGEAFNDPELIYVGTGGKQGTVPVHTSILYPDDRSAMMRSGWSDQDLYLRLGIDAGHHSHPDELDVIVYAYGQKLLPSMGTYTYNNDPISTWLRRTTESHNTIEINGMRQNWDLPAGFTEWVTNPDFDFASGFTQSTPGFTHERAILFVDSNYWIVSDFVEAPAGTHQYAQNWHFLPNANVAIDPETKRSQTHFAEGANIQVVPADPDDLSAALKGGYYSPRMYEVSGTTFTSYIKNQTGNTSFDTVLYPTRPGEQKDIQVKRLELDPLPLQAKEIALKIQLDESNYGYYYLSHDTSNTEKRTFGDYDYIGKLAYVETASNDSVLKQAVIYDGSSLEKDGVTLIDSASQLNDISVKWEDEGLHISTNQLKLNANPDEAVAIYAPDVDEVIVNGQIVSYTRVGDYIYAVGVSEGDPIEPINVSAMLGQLEENRDEIFTEDAYRHLKTHLSALRLYEQGEEADKIVTHTTGFIHLLDAQVNQGLISNHLHNLLKLDAQILLAQWQNE